MPVTGLGVRPVCSARDGMAGRREGGGMEERRGGKTGCVVGKGRNIGEGGGRIVEEDR